MLLFLSFLVFPSDLHGRRQRVRYSTQLVTGVDLDEPSQANLNMNVNCGA